MLLVFATNLSAQMPKIAQDKKYTPNYEDFFRAPLTDAPVEKAEKQTNPVLQDVSYTIVDQYRSSVWNHMSKVTPFVYDPATGYLYVVGMERVFDDQGNLAKAPIRVKRSTDNGVSWDSTVVFDEDEFGGFYPSIGVTNYMQSTNIDEIPYGVFGRALMAEGSEWVFSGGLYVYHKEGEYVPELYFQPETNNPQNGQNWAMMKTKSFVSPANEEGYTIHAGMLSPVNESYQYGHYGCFVYDVANETVITSNVPDQFQADQFRPSTSTTGSYNSPISFDMDANGKLYAAVNNVFGSTDQSPRLISVSTSEDLGQNWTDWEKMPEEMVDVYVSNNTLFDSYIFVGVYEMDAFAATGDNEWSYFFRLGLFNEGDEQLQEIFLMEAYYADGSWGLRKVANLNGTPQVFTLSYDFSTSENWIYRIQSNPLGNELQVAKTKDGNNLILKWVDLTFERPFDTPVGITFDQRQNDGSYEEVETQLDGTFSSDVFTSYRSVETGNWSDPRNQTNDTLFNKITWIPPVVDNLQSVPMISHVTPIVSNEDHPAYGLPQAMNMQIADLWPYITYSELTVEGDPVAEEKTYNANTLYDVYPNPADGIVEIPFDLAQAGNVRIEIHDALGQLVDVVLNSNQAAGLHTVNFNTAEYSTGTYYVSLVANGERMTKILNVVR